MGAGLEGAPVKDTSLSAVATSHKPVSTTLAFRIAKFGKVGVDDVLQGRFPEPGTCPMCGHRAEIEDAALTGGKSRGSPSAL